MELQVTYKVNTEQQDEEWTSFMKEVRAWQKDWDRYDFLIAHKQFALSPKDVEEFTKELKEKYILVKK
ncbi:MAG TPA: hypothetical protein PLG47_03985 [Candidatus Dojkabacteria bacterium]|nr:hypothetical protein [Candidatus Dojkabacteria bacterium]